jgi:hypothetical protein
MIGNPDFRMVIDEVAPIITIESPVMKVAPKPRNTMGFVTN